MLDARLDKLAKIQLPLLIGVVVVVSTIYHHLTIPIPPSMPLTAFLTYDILVLLLVAPLLYHCFKVMGVVQGLLLFFTVVIFAGGMEALWVFLGKLGILGDAYDYPMGGLWFLGIPLYIAVGWFIWIHVFYFLVKQLFPRATLLAVSCLCGLMAFCVDIWMDPAVVNSFLVSNSPNIWDWAETAAPKLFTVPLSNFIGWFLIGAFVVCTYEISWGQIKTMSSHPFRQVFARLAAGWILFVVVTKAIQIGLEALLPNLDLFPLGLESGGSLTPVQTVLLAITPILVVTCLVASIWRAVRDKESRKDIFLVLGFTATLGVDLQMAYALQLAFPSTFLIYLVVFPTLLPLGMLLYYLIRPVETSGLQNTSQASP